MKARMLVPPLRDAALAVGVTIALVYGAYG